jgi:hypothetical protein
MSPHIDLEHAEPVFLVEERDEKLKKLREERRSLYE